MIPVNCLGAWLLGVGMSEIPDKQAITTIHASIEAEVNCIDIAEISGFLGDFQLRIP